MNIKDHIKTNIICGIFFIGVLSSLMHFLYDLSGNFIFFAIFSPINESVWEHLKLPLLPTVIWWLLSYYILKKNYEISLKKWLFSGTISLFTCIMIIIFLYYAYTGAFGMHSTILNIIILFIAVVAGQFLAYNIYLNKKLKPYHYYTFFSIFFILLIMFILFTFITPHLPIFQDPKTGKYGIR